MRNAKNENIGARLRRGEGGDLEPWALKTE